MVWCYLVNGLAPALSSTTVAATCDTCRPQSLLPSVKYRIEAKFNHSRKQRMNLTCMQGALPIYCTPFPQPPHCPSTIAEAQLFEHPAQVTSTHVAATSLNCLQASFHVTLSGHSMRAAVCSVSLNKSYKYFSHKQLCVCCS